MSIEDVANILNKLVINNLELKIFVNSNKIYILAFIIIVLFLLDVWLTSSGDNRSYSGL